MEHLYMPHDAVVSDADKIPYLCKYSWDNGDFLTYAGRSPTPIPSFITSNKLQSFSRSFSSAVMQDVPLSDVEELFQRWFFFGLYREVFKTTFVASSCVSISASGESLLDTTSLPGLCEKWIEVHQKLEKKGKSDMVSHIVKCLQFVNDVLRTVNGLNSPYKAINKSMVNFVASTSELLGAMLHRLSFDEEYRSDVYSKTLYCWKDFHMEEASKKMRLNGWCPLDTRKVMDMLGSFSMHYFFSKMRREGDANTHEDCSEFFCQRRQVNELTYENYRRHIDPCVGCLEMNVDAKDLEKCLYEGSFPVIKISFDAMGKVSQARVESVTKAKFFIAISHVWADGFGNPKQNALRQCQMEHVALLAKQLIQQIEERNSKRDPDFHFPGHCLQAAWMRKLKGTGSFLTSEQIANTPKGGLHKLYCLNPLDRLFDSEVSTHIHVWIDTLCCPRNGSAARKLAIERMRDVYIQATAVLVLDRELQAIKNGSIYWLEGLSRILVSKWSTRLWTLQECTLAADIWIQFSDRAIELYDLWKIRLSVRTSSIQTMCLNFALISEVAILKLYENGGENRMAEISYACRNRNTSRPADEIPCLASLLQLDLSELLLIDDKVERTKTFWSRCIDIPGIPQSIVFHRASRLRFEGFRWAPKSMLGFPVTRSTKLGGRLAKKTKQGLVVEFPGFTFLGSTVFGSNVLSLPNEQGDQCWIRVKEGKWIMMAIDKEQYEYQQKTTLRQSLWQFIMSHGPNCACITERDMTSPGNNLKMSQGILGFLAWDDISIQPIFHSFCRCIVTCNDDIGAGQEIVRSIIKDDMVKEPLKSYVDWQRRGTWEMWLGRSELLEIPPKIRLWAFERCKEAARHWQASNTENASLSEDAKVEAIETRKEHIFRLLYSYLHGTRGEVVHAFPRGREWIVD